MKTQGSALSKGSVILRPRVVLKSGSKSGSQDLPVQEARSSWESQQDAESYWETRSNTADYRISGISISTVKLQDARRQCSKNIGIKEQFLRNMSQKQEISEESHKLLEDVNQTEIFELCENSAKLQCPDCNAFQEIGIIYRSCGRNLRYSRSFTTLQKTNCDFTSIPGFAIEKNSTRGPKHSSRRSRCLRKQDKRNTETIRRYFQDGTNKKKTESHYES